MLIEAADADNGELLAFTKTQMPDTTVKELKEALAKMPDDSEVRLLLQNHHLRLFYAGPLYMVYASDGRLVDLRGDLLHVATYEVLERPRQVVSPNDGVLDC